MKRMILAVIAAVTIGTNAVAQQPQEHRHGKRDKTEMVKHRTEDMTQQYGLSEEQSAQLLALNTKYADKMAPRGGRHGHRHEGGRPEGGERRKPTMTDEQRQQHRQAMEAYDQELKGILTAEQFAKYKEDMDKRRKGGPRNPKGPRN